MSQETKRLFVGNLPPHVTEEEITNKFKKYGKISSVEVKQRESSTFAFINLETTSEKLHHCLNKVAKDKWNGYHIKLELAKETFLNRLERERQMTKSFNSSFQKRGQTNEHKSDKSKKDCDLEIHNGINKSCLSEIFDGETEVNVKGGISMFKGTRSYISKNENKSKSESSIRKNHKTSDKLLLNDDDIVNKFEMYSDVWKDSTSSEVRSAGNNNRVYDSKRHFKSDTTNEVSLKTNMHVMKGKKEQMSTGGDEEKRLKSINEKKKVFFQQKQAIKTALAAVDSVTRCNSKIVFAEDDDHTVTKNTSNVNVDSNSKEGTSEMQTNNVDLKTDLLFSDDESVDDENDFKIKRQFEGKKGKKLLELQSRYASDKRFTLDERFYESDENVEDPVSEPLQKPLDERETQFRILGDILGCDLQPPEIKDIKKKNKTMLRFDPTKPEHLKFVVPKNVNLHPEKVHKRKLDDLTAQNTDCKKGKLLGLNERSYDTVSKEKFYHVKDELKQSLQKKNEKNEFSLLNLFGQAEFTEKDDKIAEDSVPSTSKQTKKESKWDSNPFKHDSSESEEEKTKDPLDNKESVPTKAIWCETFFFHEDDIRLKDGLQFLTSGRKDDEHYFSVKRRELRKIVHSKIKINQKRELQKKVGGRRHGNKSATKRKT